MDDVGRSRNGTGSEAEKDRLIEELREAVRARDEFVAIAAHELRNPMTPIIMQVSSLLAVARDPRRCRPEVITPKAEILELAVRKFVRRSTALLEISRVAAGNVRIELAEVDFSRVVSEVVGDAHIAARMARSPLEADVQEGVVGISDRLALEQVVENLLSNAIKFGAGRPVIVALHSDGRSARLTVRDRGMGIPEEDRTRIFQRFERAVTRREHGGFGIGLWLANQLVVALGGGIVVESAGGEGTTFTVTLPLGSAEPQEKKGE
jgi:two-component system OmpR family sensor kinase